MSRYTIGIDEAGRGPLAGPVAVGVVMIPEGFDMNNLAGVRDSKQLSERRRNEWYSLASWLHKEKKIACSVGFASAAMIDERGIVQAVNEAMVLALRKISADPIETRILLDGSLHAPAEFLDQLTIIKGDATEPIISLASIIAKVSRDRLMGRLSKWYPEYEFEVHKGYGTARHHFALYEHGLCSEHRASFCKTYL